MSKKRKNRLTPEEMRDILSYMPKPAIGRNPQLYLNYVRSGNTQLMLRELAAVCVRALLLKQGKFRGVRIKLLLPFNYRTLWPDFPRIVNPEKDTSKWFLKGEVNACILLDWLHERGASEWDSKQFIALHSSVYKSLREMWNEWDVYTPQDILRRGEELGAEIAANVNSQEAFNVN